MTKNLKLLSLAALALGGLGATPAMAQNLNFANGDLILGFQSKAGTGNDTNVMVNLGNTATVFRNANTNSINLDNIVNVNAILVATFGATWWDNTNLLWGAAGSWGNVIEGNLMNGDPEQSIYFTKQRTSVGANEEIAVSTVGTTPSASNQTAAANNINSLNNKFESQPGNPSQVALLNTEANTWEDFTPTTGAFVQNNAFTAYVSGVQQRFGAGSYGTSNATGSPVAIEGALDLYRSQGQTNVSGQFAEGDTLRVGRFQGFLTIDNTGNVDFITAVVPEPSSALLLGAASILGLGFRRRRTATA